MAFTCGDDDVRSASTEHDAYLAAGDVVELYIKYGEEHSQYYEIVSAPNGTTFDARWPHRGAGDLKLKIRLGVAQCDLAREGAFGGLLCNECIVGDGGHRAKRSDTGSYQDGL